MKIYNNNYTRNLS